jgi:hypothetical protein
MLFWAKFKKNNLSYNKLKNKFKNKNKLQENYQKM